MHPRSMKKQSALTFILKGLIPYTRENLLLAYKPNKFFNELEKISKYNHNTLRKAYWRGKKQGFIEESEGYTKLTKKGLKAIRPFIAKRLDNSSRLIVMFDIPESEATKRQGFRNLLKTWGFEQVQKSIWVTDMDYRDLLEEAISELGLGDCVEIHESLKIYPR